MTLQARSHCVIPSIASILMSRFLLDLQEAIHRSTYGGSSTDSSLGGPIIFRAAVGQSGTSVLPGAEDGDDDAPMLAASGQSGIIGQGNVVNLEHTSRVTHIEQGRVHDVIEEIPR